jgi:hypothetical protein
VEVEEPIWLLERVFTTRTTGWVRGGGERMKIGGVMGDTGMRALPSLKALDFVSSFL